jgi:probable phosphoglycerate mutase
MIRHGQTETNLAEVIAGQMNSPLTELGKKQAEKARSAVESLEEKPKAIIHSHLDRARDTALAINFRLGLPMHEDDRISEIYFGKWEGASYKEALEKFVNGEDPPEGETFEDFKMRVAAGVSSCCEKHESPVLFVTHGGVMRALAAIYGLKINAGHFINCHLYEFEPSKINTTLPWRVWQHDILECGTINRRTSPLFHGKKQNNLVACP